MGIRLTEEQVSALAADASSVQAGRGLAQPAKWPSLGADDKLIWGECQGSGSQPYRTCVEPAAPAYKCSCPSRKFPCKHSLGLLFLFAGGKVAFPANAPPAWAEEWLASREKRDQKKQERQEKKAETEADPEAKEKREGQRKERMASGLGDLNLWLTDILRGGLTGLEGKPPTFWEQASARLVDAQAPGLAALIAEMRAHVAARESDWPERVLALMGRMKLAIEGFARFDSLPGETRADIRSLLGWSLERSEFASQAGEVTDTWEILAVALGETGNLREQRVHLRGRSSRRQALILSFAYGNQPFEMAFVPGGVFTGTVSYYPSGYPLRALLKERSGEEGEMTSMHGLPDFQAALGAYAEALAGNPFVFRCPMTVEGLRPHRVGELLYLRDGSGRDMPVSRLFTQEWQLLSQSGGRPVNVFGEWAGGSFLPLSCWDGAYLPFLSGWR